MSQRQEVRMPAYAGLPEALEARGAPPVSIPDLPADVWYGIKRTSAIASAAGPYAVNLNAAGAFVGEADYLNWRGQNPSTGATVANDTVRGVIVAARINVTATLNAGEIDAAVAKYWSSGPGAWIAASDERGTLQYSERLAPNFAQQAYSAAADINGQGVMPLSPLVVWRDPMFYDGQKQLQLQSRTVAASADPYTLEVELLCVEWNSVPNPNADARKCKSDAATAKRAVMTAIMKARTQGILRTVNG